MNKKIIEEIDTEKMYEVYDNWPKIARDAFSNENHNLDYSRINHIVFAGMGGSGAIGDMFAAILSKTNIHINVIKGYELPKTVNSETLVITISVSGNTIETLTILESAFKINCRIIAFSSGGKMIDFCKKNKIEHIIIPLLHSPRSSFAVFLYTILKVLHKTLGIKEEDVLESINELESVNLKINSSNLTEENPALNLAKKINDIPVIYYPHGLQSAAIRFKNSLQENAKFHAMTEDVIENSHNGIVAWEKKSNVIPIIIQGKDDHLRTKERWKILKKFLKNNNIEYHIIETPYGSIITKLISIIYFLDYTTIYTAILNNTNPSPVKSIQFIKSKLN